MSTQATDVFTPSAFPEATYVHREDLRLERKLRDSLSTPGDVISISGPSKSGKTVLVESVVGHDHLILVNGASIGSGNQLWDRCLNWMGAPSQTNSGSSWTGAVGASGSAGGELSVPFVAKGKAEATGHTEVTYGSQELEVTERHGMDQVATEIANSDFVVFVDDFHYMSRPVQTDVARQIKAATALGVKICVASVPHRSDDAVRSNPELRGRMQMVDLDYWNEAHLRLIAAKGFTAMNLEVDPNVVAQLISECSGSPQLMQALCLQLCQNMDHRTAPRRPVTVTLHAGQVTDLLSDVTSRTDFSSLTRRLVEGPKTRGTERKEHQFHDGTRGDVYPVVLRAIAHNPPQLSFSYTELQNRVASVCVGQPPRPQSVSQACTHIASICEDMYPEQRIIEFDGDQGVLDVIDPYLLFFLRHR